MDIKNIIADIEREIESFKPVSKIERVGIVETVADGAVKISGLDNVAVSEMLEFPGNLYGVALNLEKESIGGIILGDYLSIHQGTEVKAAGRLLSIPVSDKLIGRVINPLGQPLDNKEEIKADKFYPLEKIAPGIIERQPVDTPLQTGIKAIDSMIPIGRGQRELIIGDRGTGKTALVLDAIINQKPRKSEKAVVCIYVAIGQKASRIAQVIDILKKHQASEYTIIVAASASDPASLQYIAPYAGCAMGEYFMDQGRDAVIFYDDLTKHAWAYRQISLILRRPSGREAYPGDIFYLHSRLLERACRLNEKSGGGSLTAIPIIETQGGDVSAYIPTNVISITDGQIYLEADLFYAGVRPAINASLSVSRVGGAAQIKAMKQVAGRLRLDLAQYRELASFVQFATSLDQKTREQIERGARLVEVLKQKQLKPLPVEEQIILIWSAVNGCIDQLPVDKIAEFEEKYLEYFRNVKSEILAKIIKQKKIDEKLEKEIRKATEEFMRTFVN